MKTRILSTLTLLVSLIFMQSCSKVTVVENEETKSHVQITVSPFTLTMEDMGTTTRSSNLSDLATRLSFAVFDSKGELVDVVIYQEISQDDFGTINLELYPGSYKLVAVAHNGDEDATISSISSVTLPGNNFTDTFSDVVELTVEANQDCSKEMLLPRATAAFVLKLLDAPPANVAKIKVVVNANATDVGPLEIEPKGRVATKNLKQTREIPIANLNEEGITVYYICMTNEQQLAVKATAYDADNKEIISHTLSGVLLKTNKQTTATGYFFKSTGAASITVNGTWGEGINISF